MHFRDENRRPMPPPTAQTVFGYFSSQNTIKISRRYLFGARSGGEKIETGWFFLQIRGELELLIRFDTNVFVKLHRKVVFRDRYFFENHTIHTQGKRDDRCRFTGEI